MKTIKYNIQLGVCVLFLLVFHSCTKNFENYNTNPNAVNAKNIHHDNVYLGGFFRQMTESIFPVGGTGSSATNGYQLAQNLNGDIFGGYHGMTHNWNSAGDNTTYNFSVGWNEVPFEMYYTRIVKNVDTIAKYAVNNPDIIGLSKVVKVHAAQRVVDMYGPIPYFKTGTTLLALGSPYDAVDAIYYSFFEDLNSAIAAMKQAVAVNAKPLQNFDPVYQGDYVKWIKFANSLKLRLAMRIVYADAVKAKQYAEEAVNDEYGVLETNTDNAEMRGVGTDANYTNPLAGLTVDYDEARMSANMESFLTGFEDPRMAAMFEPSRLAGDASNRYRGIRSGITITDVTRYIPFSRLKTNFNVIWMSAAEVFFLRAEGALRGWNMKASAKDLYESGVRVSFEQWKVTGADTYLANSTKKALAYVDPVSSVNSFSGNPPKNPLSSITIQWTAASTFEVNLERIMTQKWIATYPNGHEAWSEFRRTGYPALFPVAVNKGSIASLTTTQLKRLPYPLSEYQRNNKNLMQGITLLGGLDNGATRLWWDKNPSIPRNN